MLDTNILVYARNPTSPFHEWAVNQIASLVESEGAAFSAAGLAELCSDDAVDPTHVLPEVASFGIQLLDFPIAATVRCGEAYRAYRSNRKLHSGKEGPKMPLPDFFIGV